MRSVLGRVPLLLFLGLVGIACATGGNASIDPGGGSGNDSGTGDDGGLADNDSGSGATDSGRGDPDSGTSMDSGTSTDTGASNDTGLPVDAFVPPPDSSVTPDSSVGGACDVSSQANQQRYLAEYLIVAASSNPKPCSNGCSASECCFQILCVPL